MSKQKLLFCKEKQMPVSDQEIQAKQTQVQDLRERVSAAKRESLAKARSLENDLTATALDAEVEKLKTELDSLTSDSVPAPQASRQPVAPKSDSKNSEEG
jgi:hypothetical protein